MTHPLTPFYHSRGVALIGASASPTKLSYGTFHNLTHGRYRGKVYPVNPRYSEVEGIPCYPDIANVPDPVDLAVSALPAQATPPVIEACGRRGIRCVVIISGGFREVGAEGRALEDECVAIARRYGMRLIGPNCVGVMDLFSGVNTTFIRGTPEQGHIGFVSQSGAVCGAVIDYAVSKGIGFSNLSSLGNEADVTENDLIEYLAQDDNTRVIACYSEAIRDGRRFMDLAQQVTRVKPIVMLKAGRNEAGARAVSSHTGALAGSNIAYDTAFQQSGVLIASAAEELFDIAVALAEQPLPRGNRTLILTNAGGLGALAADSLGAHGLNLVELQPETQARLRTWLHPSAQIGNPVDMLGGVDAPEYRQALETILPDDHVDAVLVGNVPTALVDVKKIAAAIGDAAANSGKPVIACLMGSNGVEVARPDLRQRHIPMYTFPEQIGPVLGALVRYSQWRQTPIEIPYQPEKIDIQKAGAALDKAHPLKTLGEAHTRPLLGAYGIPMIPAETAHSAQAAVTAACQMGYPVALKIVSPDVLHKSEAGGIRLNLADDASVARGYAEIMAGVQRAVPTARLDGVLVEKMAPAGYEVIVGMRRDPNFGPLLMFGLGGIYVELLTDVAFRIAPLSRTQALAMIQETKAGRLLAGLRGQAAGDVDAVVDCILRLGQLALDFDEIDEVEINPLVVYPQGQGAVALDARAILK